MAKSFGFYFVAIVALFTVAGCASHVTQKNSDAKSATSPLIIASDGAKKPRAQNKNLELVVRGIKLKNTDFDFPVVINDRVEQWVDYFTGRGRPHFEKYLERSEYFIPFIKPVLKQNGIPEDFVYLAMIESGFNNHARSFAKAVGPWQFMPATGKRYGLKIDWWVDERRDTQKSTLSAARYLKDLYDLFQSWELASAAYNAGESKVARAIRRYGTTDFWALTQHKFLRPETRNYVPKIIAAALLAKNRTQFGFEPATVRPKEGQALAPDGTIVKLENASEQSLTQASQEALESVLRGEEEENASKISGVGPSDLVPETTPEKSVAGEAVPLSIPHVNKKGELFGEQLAEFEVESPADLMQIAQASNLSYHTVKSLNPELMRWCTPPRNNAYRIRLPASAKQVFLSRYNHADFVKKAQFQKFRVTRGQSLQAVARHFGIKTDPLVDLNHVSQGGVLKAGSLVQVPIPMGSTLSMAALEIRDPPSARRAKHRSRSARRFKRVSYEERSKNKVRVTF